LKELPQAIERLEKRIADLTADMATIRDNNTFLVGGKPAAEATLTQALKGIPEYVDRWRRFPLAAQLISVGQHSLPTVKVSPAFTRYGETESSLIWAYGTRKAGPFYRVARAVRANRLTVLHGGDRVCLHRLLLVLNLN
jgi:hypothetical protein